MLVIKHLTVAVDLTEVKSTTVPSTLIANAYHTVRWLRNTL